MAARCQEWKFAKFPAARPAATRISSFDWVKRADDEVLEQRRSPMSICGRFGLYTANWRHWVQAQKVSEITARLTGTRSCGEA